MSALIVPDDLLRRLGRSNEEALVEIACRLYETNRLRLDEGARLASLELSDFAKACEARRIPVYWYTEHELEHDLETLTRIGL